MNASLADFRAKTIRIFVALLWAHIPVSALIWVATGTSSYLAPLTVTALATVATLHQRRRPGAEGPALTAAAAMAIIVGVLVYQMRGSAWQLDAHMYFFAAFSITAILVRWRPLILFAAVVAVHHLVLNFALTEAVFPGTADLGRVVLHAVVLIAQAVPLVLLVVHLSNLFGHAERALSDAKTAEAGQQSAAAEQAVLQAALARVVADLTTALSQIAAGNLTARIPNAAANPFPPANLALLQQFDDFAEVLETTIRSVADEATELYASSGQLAQVAQGMSSRAESQSDTLQRSSGTLTDLTRSIGNTARLVAKANEAMKSTLSDAEVGASILTEAVGAMARIEESSSKISQIVDVIDDISFQTNLLALNAGVEAARAGEAGRGFAVVAAEVRQLAQRATDSARDIRGLIAESGAKVAEGSKVVARTAQSLRSLNARSQEAGGVIAEIAGMAQQQATDLTTVAGDLRSLEQATQESAAIAEQSTAASITLHDQAERLNTLLAGFNFATQTPVPAAPPARTYRMAG